MSNLKPPRRGINVRIRMCVASACERELFKGKLILQCECPAAVVYETRDGSGTIFANE